MAESQASRRAVETGTVRLGAGLRIGAAAQASLALGSLLVSTLAARLLAPADLATFFVATSIVATSALVATLGLDRVGTRTVASNLALDDQAKVGHAVRLTRRTSAVSAAIAALLVGPSGPVLDYVFPDLRLSSITWWMGALIALRVLAFQRAELLRGFHEVGKASVLRGVDAAILTAALLGVAWSTRGSASLQGVLTLQALAWVPGILLGSLLLRRRERSRRGPTSLNARGLLRSGLPLAAHATALAVGSHVHLWVVAAALPATDTASYGAAVRLTMVVAIPLQVVNSVVPSAIAHFSTQSRRTPLEDMLRATAGVATIVAVGLSLPLITLGGPILARLFGDSYSGAAGTLAVLVIGQVLNVAFGSCQYTLMMMGHERVVMAIGLGSTLVMAAGAALIVAPWGSVGVAAVVSLAIAVQNVLAWEATRRLEGVRTHAAAPWSAVVQLHKSWRQLLVHSPGDTDFAGDD